MDARNHTGHVFAWPEEKPPHAEKVCDGVIWSHEGMAICFPGGCPILTFVDEEKNLFGILHCSWKTIGQRIITNFNTTWLFNGGRPKNTSVRFLPAICQDCLTFDLRYWEKEVRDPLEWTGVCLEEFSQMKEDRIGLSLARLSTSILQGCGYTRIENDGVCTCCSGEYWCYRHHDVPGGERFRNAAFLLVE